MFNATERDITNYTKCHSVVCRWLSKRKRVNAMYSCTRLHMQAQKIRWEHTNEYECVLRLIQTMRHTWLPYCTNEKNVCTAQKEETDKNNVANITLWNDPKKTPIRYVVWEMTFAAHTIHFGFGLRYLFFVALR